MGHFDEEEEDEETSEMQERPQMMRKESDLSLASDDIDVEEPEEFLEEPPSVPRSSPESLEEAPSISRSSPEGSEDRKPFIRPLEYEESDYDDESSEQTPLSIIQEEDEEDLSESIPFPSNMSRSHSASEEFESDDDVMDLLDEDQDREQSTGRGLDFGSVRKISQTERVPLEHKTSDGLGFDKYLTNSSDQPKDESHYRLLDNVQLEESEGGEGEHDGLETTYSDTEADREGVERTSTPLDEYEEGIEQEEAPHGETTPSAEGQAPSDQGYVDEMAPEEQVRVFLALYDYDPSTMSPNPDAEDEELAFNEGDLIKVIKWSVLCTLLLKAYLHWLEIK